MRGLLAALFLIAGCGRSSAPARDPQLEISVDRRVEILSILFRLARSPVYLRSTGAYADEVDRQFAPFADHAAVRDSARLGAERGIGHDGPMELAVYLDDTFHPIRPLTPRPPGLDDPRWNGVDLDGYLSDVRSFAKDSGFDGFFAAHAAHYAEVAATFRRFLATRPIIPWFDGVFGARPHATYHLAPGLEIGPWNFGIRGVGADGHEEILQVMFLENPDAAGDFAPTELTREVLVHEVAHPYINPLVDAGMPALDDVAAPLFARVGPLMMQQSYPTAQIMMRESVVRAVTLLYVQDRSDEAHRAANLQDQIGHGFLWTGELADALSRLRAAHGGALPAGEVIPTVHAALVDWIAQHPT